MNVMAPTRPTELRGCRVRLTTGPAAAAEARRQVRAAICAWEIPVDPDVAILLTSELVTNAIRHEVTGIVMLAITCSCGQHTGNHSYEEDHASMKKITPV
jgi:hypothetical protein